jgi:hypothetical protein
MTDLSEHFIAVVRQGAGDNIVPLISRLRAQALRRTRAGDARSLAIADVESALATALEASLEEERAAVLRDGARERADWRARYDRPVRF